MEDPLQTQFQQEVPDVYGPVRGASQGRRTRWGRATSPPSSTSVGPESLVGAGRRKGGGGEGSWWEGAALYAGGIVLVW